MQRADRRLPEKALDLWQQRTARELTQEDTREITENVAGFFRILLEWRATADPRSDIDREADSFCGPNHRTSRSEATPETGTNTSPAPMSETQGTT